eukprot:855676-Amphidinium_carterae.1
MALEETSSHSWHLPRSVACCCSLLHIIRAPMETSRHPWDAIIHHGDEAEESKSACSPELCTQHTPCAQDTPAPQPCEQAAQNLEGNEIADPPHIQQQGQEVDTAQQ